MSARPPVLAGLTRDCGTSTLAAALHAHDAGRLDGSFRGRADVVVCRGDDASLDRAGTVAAVGAPVLAVLATGCAPRARLRALEGRFGAVVLLPEVAPWRGLAAPLDEAAALLGQQPEHLPRSLRELAMALRQLVEALISTGLLALDDPPLVSQPRAVAPGYGSRPLSAALVVAPEQGLRPLSAAPLAVPGPGPVEPPGRIVPVPAVLAPIAPPPPLAVEPDLDDDALEALVTLVAAGAW